MKSNGQRLKTVLENKLSRRRAGQGSAERARVLQHSTHAPEEMADGYWNRQPPQNPSAGVLKRPRSDYGMCPALICEEFLHIHFYMFNLMIYELRV
ncbi:hypothetical protein Acr_21g0005200 [Actinidia rufa]|uniref:Uncharacterized protein n=1 Tax=Actinidia rufa TaxID=165716 RepID=A0A7J0GGS2_9ERIC|nr:hypothetical protein Acr_21g0005200 [Actinidia rufa]